MECSVFSCVVRVGICGDVGWVLMHFYDRGFGICWVFVCGC